eukprot:Opistho-2@32881
MPSSRNSSAMPSTQNDMPYFAIVYAVWFLNHRGLRLMGGEILRMCPWRDFFRWGRHAWLVAYVPRALTPFMRSYFFMGVSRVPVRLMADALLIKISIPPNLSTACATAVAIWFSSRMSVTHGRHFPPAASISSAALKTVPGSFAWGVDVFAAMTTLAPSLAAFRAICLPIPRLAPVMKRVRPLRAPVLGIILRVMCCCKCLSLCVGNRKAFPMYSALI